MAKAKAPAPKVGGPSQDLTPRGNLPDASVIPEWRQFGYGAEGPAAPKPAPKKPGGKYAGGRIKKMAEGGMTDEEKYGKVGAAIRRLDPEAYKNRKDRSAEANLRLLKELREKARGTRKMDTKEFIEKYEESDTPAGRITETKTKTMMEPRRAGQGISQIRSMISGDDEESPAMKNIRIAREMARSKGPGSRYTPAQGMSMAERRMREAGRMNMGGSVKKYAKGGSVSSASRRADGIAKKGKTKGRMV